jgi:hypothetical protein
MRLTFYAQLRVVTRDIFTLIGDVIISKKCGNSGHVVLPVVKSVPETDIIVKYIFIQ